MLFIAAAAVVVCFVLVFFLSVMCFCVKVYVCFAYVFLSLENACHLTWRKKQHNCFIVSCECLLYINICFLVDFFASKHSLSLSLSRSLYVCLSVCFIWSLCCCLSPSSSSLALFTPPFPPRVLDMHFPLHYLFPCQVRSCTVCWKN